MDIHLDHSRGCMQRWLSFSWDREGEINIENQLTADSSRNNQNNNNNNNITISRIYLR